MVLVEADALAEQPLLQLEAAFAPLNRIRNDVLKRRTLLPTDMQEYRQRLEQLNTALSAAMHDRLFYSLLEASEFMDAHREVASLDGMVLSVIPSQEQEPAYASFLNAVQTITLCAQVSTIADPNNTHHILQLLKYHGGAEPSVRDQRKLQESVAPFVVPADHSKKQTITGKLFGTPGYHSMNNGFTLRYDGTFSDIEALVDFASTRGYTDIEFFVPRDRIMAVAEAVAERYATHMEVRERANEGNWYGFGLLRTTEPKDDFAYFSSMPANNDLIRRATHARGADDRILAYNEVPFGKSVQLHGLYRSGENNIAFALSAPEPWSMTRALNEGLLAIVEADQADPAAALQQAWDAHSVRVMTRSPNGTRNYVQGWMPQGREEHK